MDIEISSARERGSYHIHAVDPKHKTILDRFMKEYGRGRSGYVRLGHLSTEDQRESLEKYVGEMSDENWADIRHRNGATFRDVDAWKALHFWGWDAHTLAEDGTIR